MRLSTTPKVQPLAAWLPLELVYHILAFITEEDAALNGFFVGLAHMCRGWYHPVTTCIYRNAAPASFQSCKLLIRSLDNDPQLSFLIKSLTIPKDTQLFSADTFSVHDLKLVQSLVGKCTQLVELRIPMNSGFTWTNNLVQAYLPSLKQCSNLRSLEISAFNAIDPSCPRNIAAEYVSMWLLQVSSLPQLERLALSGVAFSPRSYRWGWPSLPSLRYLWLDRPWCSVEELIPLLSQAHISLKVLHVTGLFQQGQSQGIFRNHFESLLISTHFVASTLEELTIDSLYHGLPDLWSRDGLAHMTSLRRLHISSQFYCPILITKLPPSLDTLVILMYGALNIRGLLKLLPGTTVNNLVIKGSRYVYEMDHLEVAITAPAIPPNEERAREFKHKMYQLAQELGINFRMETHADLSPRFPKRLSVDFPMETDADPSPGFPKRGMRNWRMKFFQKLGLLSMS